MPAGTWFSRKSVKWIRGSSERTRADVFRGLAARHLGSPVQQAAWYARVRRSASCRAPATARVPAVRAVEDVGAGRIGVDRRASRDSPHLFREEWIVRDKCLRLLREAIGLVELVRAGEPDDLRQRLLPRPVNLRVALRPPCDATRDDGERDDRGRKLRAARRPRPRGRRLWS